MKLWRPGRYLATIMVIGISCTAAADAPVNATRGEIDAFVQADRNGDAILTASEFRSFVDAMATQGQSTARMIRFFGAYGYAFSVADADGNGLIEPEELRNADDSYKAGSN